MNGMRKAVSVLLCFVFVIVTCFVSLNISASGLYNRHGYINDSAVNIRTGAGTGNESLGKLAINTPVLIKGVDFDGNGIRWYQLTAYTSGGDIDGYVHSGYVTVTGSDKTFSALVNKTTTVRSAPGTWNSAITQLSNGATVTVIGCEDDSDGDMWYHVSFINGSSTATGYIYETCIDIIPTYKEDPEFEKHLTEQGFPASYKPYLRNLHSLYPEWVFVADKLDMTWEEAVEGEGALGRSVISSSAKESWKSLEEDCYNWTTGTFETWDSGGWVQAADSVIEYYLDPRNFLTSSGIFQFISMKYYPEYHTKENVEASVKGTFMEGEFPEETYETYTDVLIKAAEESGVSPISLASMIIVEQGSRGTGKCISGTVSGYEGYYNFYNIRAYRSGSYSAIQYGLLYAKGSDGAKEKYDRPWDTRAKSIIGGAAWYNENYVSRGQDTLYYKKFNVVSKPYFSHQYMTNIQGAASEANKTADGYSKVMDTPLVFNIPVFKAMPETAAPYPISVGNNDCYLADASIDNYKLTPSFDRYVNEYELVVADNVESVVVTPLASDSAATVTGGGRVSLNYGNNEVKVKVVSTSGIENVYTFYIYRQVPSEVKFSFDVGNYEVDGSYIYGIRRGASISEVISGFNIVGGSAKITNPDGSTPSKVGSGDIIRLYNNKGELEATYYFVIEGDANGDGDLDLVDVTCVQRSLIYMYDISGGALKAVDFNRDGRISIVDLSRIRRKFLSIY